MVVMQREHAPEHLQQALAELRCRHADWPDDVAAVLDDPIRGRLLRIGASLVAVGRHIGRADEVLPPIVRPAVIRPEPPPSSALRLRPLPAHDRKRAAAGERDDDE